MAPRALALLLALLLVLVPPGGARPGPAAPSSAPPAPTTCPPAGPRCPPGTYPHPPPRHRPGRCPPAPRGTPVVCREVRCPAPLSLPQGGYSPTPRRPSHPPGALLDFACEGGLVLRGSPRRRCRPGGLWSGSSPVCDDGAGDCPPAPAPAGGVVTGRGRQRGAEVHVRCGAGLTLQGPAHRRCLETGRWSGPEPVCRHPYAYDLPEDVSEGFGASLTSVLELAGAHPHNGSSLGRRIVLTPTGSLRVYLLLDASGSVSSENFRLFQECGAAVVDRLSSFEVSVSFAIVSFASRARVIVSTAEDESADADEVLQRLENMTFADHGNATGTNVRGALMEVYHMLLFEKARAERLGRPEAWRGTRHVVILLTDGRFNVGGHPRDAVAKIEDVLEIKPDREEYLDIYAFGVGALEVDMAELAAVASHRRDETHAFKLADAAALRQALEAALVATTVGDLCGVIVPAGAPRPPWHVILRVRPPPRRGPRTGAGTPHPPGDPGGRGGSHTSCSIGDPGVWGVPHPPGDPGGRGGPHTPLLTRDPGVQAPPKPPPRGPRHLGVGSCTLMPTGDLGIWGGPTAHWVPRHLGPPCSPKPPPRGPDRLPPTPARGVPVTRGC
ncbi:complement C2 isoform X3 [Phalacrocorax carbo]|uniref:complement C2 isoform X3 n=1 Tax=Phalacrocorax carbo TaxID=9209 RepID=UPI00311996EC